MSAFKTTIEWRPREPPLLPCAVAAQGDAAIALARRAATSGRSLSCVAANGLIVLLGSAEDLPWVDGALYLGRDPNAPNLLLPTALAPTVPADLVERALTKRFASARPPLAILVEHGSIEVAPVGEAHLVSAHDLNGWAAQQAAR
jgi:hypothetical protein